MFFKKKKMVGPSKKRVLRRTPMRLASKKTSPLKLENRKTFKFSQKKLIFFKKKKTVGPSRKRVLRQTPMKLASKKTSPLKLENRKTFKEEIDNIAMAQRCSAHRTVKSPALHRAQEFQSKLPTKFPSFVKYMLKSHVTGTFWLSLPKPFCDSHLPKQDETVLLVGEDFKEYRTNYLTEKNGLSDGWRAFALAQKLVEGDVLIFQLIESLKFKVHIVRANSLTETDGALSLLNLDSRANATDVAHREDELEGVKNIKMIAGDRCLEPWEKESHQEDDMGDKITEALGSELVAASQQTKNESDELGSAVVEGIRLAESVLEFKDIKGFDSFSILIDGLVIDSEIPMQVRYNYFELCHNQNAFLHENLVKGLNCKLAAGIIFEIVNIANAISAAKFYVNLEHLDSWDRTLKAFEDMGMKVGFLRTRLQKLTHFSYEQQEIIRSKKLEQARLEEEIRDLETKFLNDYEVKKALDAEIEALIEIIKSKELKQARLEEEMRDLETKLLKDYEVKKALDAEIEALIAGNSGPVATFANTSSAAW